MLDVTSANIINENSEAWGGAVDSFVIHLLWIAPLLYVSKFIELHMCSVLVVKNIF